jgi:hypothetical protein
VFFVRQASAPRPTEVKKVARQGPGGLFAFLQGAGSTPALTDPSFPHNGEQARLLAFFYA